MRLKLKGSILAYSLLVLAAMFAIVASVSTVSILEKKNAGSTQASSQAFQVADSGVQLAIKKINLATSGSTISDVFSSCSVSGGAATVQSQLDSTKPYTLTFFKADGSQISACSENLTSIDSIKSIGNYQNTVRAVSVVMAASGVTDQLFTDSAGVKGSLGVPVCMGYATVNDSVNFNQFCLDNGFKFGNVMKFTTGPTTCQYYDKTGNWTTLSVSGSTYYATSILCIKY